MTHFNWMKRALASDPDIDEVGFLVEIPDKVKDDANPQSINTFGPFVVVEHKLGIPFHCMSSLFQEAHECLLQRKSQLNEAWQNQQLKNAPASFSEKKASEGASVSVSKVVDAHNNKESINASAVSFSSMEDEGLFPLDGWPIVSDSLKSVLTSLQETNILKDLNDASKAILLISAENYMAWNARKWLVAVQQQNLQSELHFLNLIFSKHPKSPEGWAHRKHISHLKLQDFGSSEMLKVVEFLKSELKICLKLADSYQNNYFCWTYRHWIVYILAKNSKELLEDELNATRLWTRSHRSDYAAWHHKEFVLLLCIQYWCPSIYQQIFKSTLDVSSQILSSAHQPSSLLEQPAADNEITNPYNSSTGTSIPMQTHPLKAKFIGKWLDDWLSPELTAILLSDKCCQVWLQEMGECSAMIELHPGLEALWYHLRFLLSHWFGIVGTLSALYSGNMVACENMSESSINCKSDLLSKGDISPHSPTSPRLSDEFISSQRSYAFDNDSLSLRSKAEWADNIASDSWAQHLSARALKESETWDLYLKQHRYALEFAIWLEEDVNREKMDKHRVTFLLERLAASSVKGNAKALSTLNS